MKKVVILHGTNGTPQSNWFPWLAKELEQRGFIVWCPPLPHSDRPNIDRYNEFLLRESPLDFYEDTIFVGHSSGAVAILGFLDVLPESTKVGTCILVSAFINNLGWDSLAELFLKPFNIEFIKKRAKKFIFLHSDNDPYCPLNDAKQLAEKLNGDLIVREGQGHFNLEVGQQYRQFPFLLDLVAKK